jgi:hypothetical protein
MRRGREEGEQVRKDTSSTLARLADRQQEVTRLEKALSAALVRSDMDGGDEPPAAEPCPDAALVRDQAAELKQEAEQLAQVLAAAVALDDHHHEAGTDEAPPEEEPAPDPEELEPAPATEADGGEGRVSGARVDGESETTREERRPREIAGVAPGPAQQNAMLESLFRFLEHDEKPGR